MLIDLKKRKNTISFFLFAQLFITLISFFLGPISGVLNSHLAVRTIVFIGCLLSAIGVGLCYFATSVADIVVFIGIIQGMNFCD